MHDQGRKLLTCLVRYMLCPYSSRLHADSHGPSTEAEKTIESMRSFLSQLYVESSADSPMAMLIAIEKIGHDKSACKLSLHIVAGLWWRLEDYVYVLTRDFPASQLTASSAADWKHAYLLQVTNTLADLQCFFTKASFEQQACPAPPIVLTTHQCLSMHHSA